MSIRTLLACTFLLVPAAALANEPIADAGSLERDVRVLADDSMEGREAGTAGYALAAGYVAGRFAAIGLEPGGDEGSYFQEVPMRRVARAEDGANTLAFPGASGLGDIEPWEHYIVSGNTRIERGHIEAPLVFVGYGLELPQYGRDDFAGVDVAGKIAVRLAGAPAFLNTEERAHYRSTIGQRLSERGAVGMITLYTPALTRLNPYEKAAANSRHDAGMVWVDKAGEPFTLAPTILAGATLSPELSRRLMDGQPMAYEALVAAEASERATMKSFDMGMTARIDFASTFTPAVAPNVIAILRGTDPAVADEYVVLTAHLDHEGVKPPEEPGGDAIYNGAMDNAVGTASMIEVARLLAADPPRRPVVFTAVTAEEKGLIGSSYNAMHPTVQADEIVANLNLDMPIVTYHFTDVNAFGAERSNMFETVRRAVESAGLTLSPDPEPEQSLFVRSDQYSYVKEGVPAIYLKTGFADGGKEAQESFRRDHYHQPSDEADLVAFDQLARFTNVNEAIARGVANMAERPAWRDGDFFGTTFARPVAQ